MRGKNQFDNARLKGKKAFYEGIPLKQNPMRATDSRMYWEDAWKAAKEREERIMENINNTCNHKPNVCIVCGRPAIGSHICPMSK